MSAVIVSMRQPERRETSGRGNLPVSRQAAAAAASHSHRKRYGAIFAHTVVPVRRTVRARATHVMTALLRTRGGSLNHDTKSVRMNSRRPFGAGNRIPGSLPRVHDCSQPSHVVCPFTHVENSFCDASASELQKITGGVGNVRKAFGEIRNVEC